MKKINLSIIAFVVFSLISCVSTQVYTPVCWHNAVYCAITAKTISRAERHEDPTIEIWRGFIGTGGHAQAMILCPDNVWRPLWVSHGQVIVGEPFEWQVRERFTIREFLILTHGRWE
jgi:hypothetical protein